VVALAEARDVEQEVRVALAAGDVAGALTVLMRRFGDEIYRHCRHMVGPTLVDEVHQAVFVQAFRDLPRFAGRSTLRSWLYAIARHRCLDALKLTRRWQRRFFGGAALPEAVDPAPTPDEHAEARRLSIALDAALARLKPEVRVAVLLRYQEGMSFEEMAAVCEERPATLQARVARAMPVLKDWLESMGVTR
jgi:RNA polymerase sigma factor (sigma-70 family)